MTPFRLVIDLLSFVCATDLATLHFYTFSLHTRVTLQGWLSTYLCSWICYFVQYSLQLNSRLIWLVTMKILSPKILRYLCYRGVLLHWTDHQDLVLWKAILIQYFCLHLYASFLVIYRSTPATLQCCLYLLGSFHFDTAHCLDRYYGDMCCTKPSLTDHSIYNLYACLVTILILSVGLYLDCFPMKQSFCVGRN